MKKFSFRLETLLHHRKNIEERERTKFSRIRIELAAEVENLQRLRTRQAQAMADLTLVKAGSGDQGEITWHYRFQDRLFRNIEQSSNRIARLEGELETQKQVMIESSRDAKMIANLRSKKEKEFLVDLERNEQKSIDEIVVTRHSLKA
jgi:flagellar FliJ protein